MYLGQCEGLTCRVSSSAPNRSVLIIGQSGSGKSCRQNQIELAETLAGNTVIVIDVSQNHREADVFRPIQNEYNQHCNRIKVVEDGCGFEILKSISDHQGVSESYVNLVNSNVQAFSSSRRMGTGQQAILREAIEKAITAKNRNQRLSDEDALRSVFNYKEDDTKWKVVYQKLWTELNCGALRSGKKHVQGQAINILDLSGLDILSAETLAEVLLSYLWRVAYNSGYPKGFGTVTIVGDEFQHLSLTKQSTLCTMLREGRKFGISLILTTQSLNIFSREELSMLGQAATKLYFHPADSDLNTCAKMIDPSRNTYWRGRLASLKRGECLGVGSLDINGNDIKRPLKLSGLKDK